MLGRGSQGFKVFLLQWLVRRTFTGADLMQSTDFFSSGKKKKKKSEGRAGWGRGGVGGDAAAALLLFLAEKIFCELNFNCFGKRIIFLCLF